MLCREKNTTRIKKHGGVWKLNQTTYYTRFIDPKENNETEDELVLKLHGKINLNLYTKKMTKEKNNNHKEKKVIIPSYWTCEISIYNCSVSGYEFET